MAEAILVINAGSKTIGFSLYRVESLRLMCRGDISDLISSPLLKLYDSAGCVVFEEKITVPPTQISLLDHEALHAQIDDATRYYPQAIGALVRWLEDHGTELELAAICHRVMHGGRIFDKPVMLNQFVLGELETLIPLAPLHQPGNLLAIRLLMKRYALVPHVAFFDTAFHFTLPEVARRYPLPRRLREKGIERYGFNGLAYEYIAWSLPQYLKGEKTGKVIALHLGRGASLCAMQDGQSVATTMGFTALDGAMMSTRSGAVDPGAVLYMIREMAMMPEHVMQLLYYESGLKGMSGISDDMRVLLASDKPQAKEAIALYIHRLVHYFGAMMAELGGLDAVVFSGGIGEHSAEIRRMICDKLAWTGIALDEEANARHQPHISPEGAKVAVLVIPSDEEMMMAMQALDMLESANNNTSQDETLPLGAV